MFILIIFSDQFFTDNNIRNILRVILKKINKLIFLIKYNCYYFPNISLGFNILTIFDI